MDVSIAELGILPIVHTEPFYSNPRDVPEQAPVFASTVWHVPTSAVTNLPLFVQVIACCAVVATIALHCQHGVRWLPRHCQPYAFAVAAWLLPKCPVHHARCLMAKSYRSCAKGQLQPAEAAWQTGWRPACRARQRCALVPWRV